MSMVTIGTKLKQAREKRSLTIADAQKQTFIHAPVLTALEEGRCDEILSPTYVKSFLKKYALYLGLDPKEMLDEYIAAHGGQPERVSREHHTIAQSTLPADNMVHGEAFRGAVIVLIGFLIIAGLALLTFAGVRLIHSLSKSRKVLPASIIAVEKVKAPLKNAPKANVKKTVPAKTSTAPKEIPLTVVIRVKSSVLVEAKKDGEKLFRRKLPKGASEVISARKNIELYIANGRSVEIFLDGKSLGSPGRGIIKSLEITRSGMKVR